MALIIPRSSVGTVQLMLLNLLQAVVIMADISLLRVTKSREGNFARPPWLVLCQAVHCWDDHRACQRWALESLRSEWGQYGHPLKCLGKDQRCLLKTLSGLSPRAEGTLIPTRSEENPGREEGLLPQLAPESKQTKPYCCSERCLWGDPSSASCHAARAWCLLDSSGWIWNLKPWIFAKFALYVDIRSTLPTITQPDQAFTRLLTRIIRNFLCTFIF